MCIIVHRPANTPALSKEIWEECFRCHKDGAGLAYVHPEQGLVVQKGFMKFEQLYERLKEIAPYESVVHFRTASPGMDVIPEMTHPFEPVMEHFQFRDKPRYRFVVFHNGRLPWAGSKDKSDTYNFVHEQMSPHLDRDPYLFESAEGKKIYEMAITTHTCVNKMVVMRQDNKTMEVDVCILNEQAGDKAHGCWFSNKTWEPKKYTHHYGEMGEYLGGFHLGSNILPARRQVQSINYDEMKTDAHGWAWSYRFDVWINASKKCYCHHLPNRKKPYDTVSKMHHDQLVKDYRRVFVTDPANPIDCPKEWEDEMNKFEQQQEPTTEVKEIEDTSDFNAPALDHLDNNQKSILCKKAVSFLRTEAGLTKADIRKMSSAEKVEWLRVNICDWIDELKGQHYVDIDIWVIQAIKDGTFDDKIKKALFIQSSDRAAAASEGMGVPFGL